MSAPAATPDVMGIMTAHIETVEPGQPATFTAGCTVGDGIWQGDLGIEIVAAVPEDYVRVAAPKEADLQLVPGNTQGARHVLDAFDGVELYRPDPWDGEGLRGPCLVVSRTRVIGHPTHGPVTLLPGFIYNCRYQREWDQEQRAARRTQD